MAYIRDRAASREFMVNLSHLSEIYCSSSAGFSS
jgi:hypothetical protein